MAQKTETVDETTKAEPKVEPTWRSTTTCDGVKALIFQEYGHQDGRPDVRPLYEGGGLARYRVNYRKDGFITSSFRVAARLASDGLVKETIVKERGTIKRT